MLQWRQIVSKFESFLVPFTTHGRWSLGLGIFGLVLLGGCSAKLDTEAIALSIQSDLQDQSDIRFEKVICPKEIEPSVGQVFYCWGKLSENEFFPIEVEQLAEFADTDVSQVIDWRISTSRTMLNLAQLELTFQDALAEEIAAEIDQDLGIPIRVDCGATYRENTPGESFSCQVNSGVVIDKRRLETVKVTVDSQGNLNWQGVRNLVTPEELEIAQEDGVAFESVVSEVNEAATSEATVEDATQIEDNTQEEGQQAILSSEVD